MDWLPFFGAIDEEEEEELAMLRGSEIRGRMTPRDRLMRAQEKWAAAGCEPLGIPRPTNYRPNGNLAKRLYVGPDGNGQYVVVHDGRILSRGSWKTAMDFYGRVKHGL